MSCMCILHYINGIVLAVCGEKCYACPIGVFPLKWDELNSMLLDQLKFSLESFGRSKRFWCNQVKRQSQSMTCGVKSYSYSVLTNEGRTTEK